MALRKFDTRSLLPIGYAPNGVDILHLGQVLADLLEDCRELVVGEHQRVCGKQLDGAGVGYGGGKLGEVLLDLAHGCRAKGHALVHGAELAPVVRASARDFQEWPRGLVGVAVYRLGEVHGDSLIAVLRRYLGVPTLSRAHAFEARHFAHGNVGCVVDWLRGSFDATPEQLAAQMYACLPAVLRDAYAAVSLAGSGGS